MKLETAHRDVSMAGVQSIHRATIAQSSKVFDFFANQTYSDKFKAIVRELVANAIDAHTEAGNPNPIDVFLPDEFDPYFRVKDSGIGMSYEFCTNNFMCYSDGSTKDNSDLVIGGFGIGSKSPFAYTDQFTLRSVHNGTINIFTVFKDEEGIPSIALLDSQPTNEVNGVEFSLPVEPEDFYKFRDAAVEGLQYFNPLPRLHGAALSTPDFLQQGTGWAIRRGHGGSPQVIMGGVPYPVDSCGLDYETRQDPLLGMNLDLFLPIGSCSVTLSRESLLYDDKTKASIKQALKDIVDEVVRDIPTMFDDQPSLWDAMVALDEHLGGQDHTARSRLVLQHSQYRGQKLSTLEMFTACTWIVKDRRGRRGHKPCSNPKWELDNYIRPGAIHTLIVDDEPKSNVKRMRKYIDDELERDDKVLVVKFHDLDKLGSPSNYILCSDLPEPEKVIKTGNGVRQLVRMFQVTEKGRYSYQLHPRQWSSPVRELLPQEQPLEGVVVIMDNFNVPANTWSKMFLFDEVVFANKVDAEKMLKQGFVDLQVEFEKRLKDALVAEPYAAQRLALRRSCLKSVIEFIDRNPDLFTSVPKSSPLTRLMSLNTKPVPEKLHQFITPQPPARVDPEKLLASIKDRHWQFFTLLDNCNHNYMKPDTDLFKLFKDLI
jgi:hypothetical protein